METVLFLSAILELILLICFFVLCSRIGKIKKNFYPELNYARFCLLLYLGRRDDATRMLYTAVSEDEDFVYAFHTDNKAAERARENMQASYGKYFSALGLELDFEKIRSVANK